MTVDPEADVFRALATEFERLSGALDYMHKVYTRPGMDGSGRYDQLLRQMNLN